MPNYNSTLQTNNSSLEEIITQLNNMPDAGGTDTSDATASAGDILNGKTAYVKGSKVTGNIATVTQATPTVTINTANGLITATATQTAGYVTAGTKSGTKQLAFQAAQTITPGTTDKTIAANTYLGGAQTIKGDANLVASNIVSGKSIFGVVGTATIGGGGDTSIEDGLVTRAATTYTNNRVTTIGQYAFYYCVNLASVSFPEVISISASAFAFCSSLTNVSLPEVRSIDDWAFYYCNKLASINLPKISSIGDSAFARCTKLTNVSFPMATSIGLSAFQACTSLARLSFPKVIYISSSAFYQCTKLASIYLGASTVCRLVNSNAFSYTSIWSNKGSIFVPASLLSSYKSATNWAFFSARIFSYNFT